MLELIQVDKTNELIKIFKLKSNDQLYFLNLEKKNIGSGIIREEQDNKIEIYILKQYQQKGYGTYLLKELLKIIKQDVKVKIKIENTIMQKIIVSVHGLELGRNGEYIQFIIPNINKKYF